MPVMQVRIVGVPVHEPRVTVHVHMRFARRIVRRVRVLMMLVMHMRVLVRHFFMRVLVVVPLD